MSSLFSRIISGEIPSYKLYEDEYTYAFLDIFPQKPGHTLIVPKVEVDHFADVPEPYYSAIFQTAKKLAPALKKVTDCHRVAAMFLGFEVPHCHYQLIPVESEQDISFVPHPQASPPELEMIQAKILEALNS